MNPKLRKMLAADQMKKPITPFVEIDLNTVPYVPPGMTRSYKNTQYVVMVYDNEPVTTGYAIRAMIQRHDDSPIPGHWSEMQKIKNEIFGTEATAIEYYPPESELVNFHNIYWMWIFPDNVLPKPLKA